ncbi:ATP synthase F1 subunit delta [Candidatus Portiera aleyrodidarum]|uniref:ATP synthase subunit delta n=1 Tax=Candidatus Portiera aleyrodidarum TaxID=91844 RepID=A0A6S6S5F0_9GAMM|nr:ATP synthase F1 subunit delta [Candidatus Portiera aleyrodidarum]CAA3708679.1 ATP synthase subunit delta [Candidatus Portiera aleyrodidarum]
MKISEKLENNNPYFKAIWELAVCSKDLDEWKNRIKKIDFILNYYKKNNICKYFVFNKKITLDLDKESLNIINLLLINNKINIINYILLYYEKQILKQYKILNIRIISAFILNKKQKKKIINILSLKFKKKIFIKKIKIKKNIMGGVIIKIKNIVIDCSIIGRLNQLKKTLIGSN